MKLSGHYFAVVLTVMNYLCVMGNASVSIPSDYTGDQKVNLAKLSMLTLPHGDSVNV
jgi:hypothetical protein